MDHFDINQLVDKTEREGRGITQAISVSHSITLGGFNLQVQHPQS